jgi:hypothetical protein
MLRGRFLPARCTEAGMTLDDFRRLIARISLAAPLRPTLVPVRVEVPATRHPVGPRRPVRLSPVRPA